MKKEKLNDVGELLEVQSSDITESKIKKFLKRFSYPLAQIAFFLLSSISGVLLGYWERQVEIGYPYNSLTRIHRVGIPTILIIHGGNAVFSTKTRKKFGLTNYKIIVIVIINLLISFISFYTLYPIVADRIYFGIMPMYGSYKKKNNRNNLSKALFMKKNHIRKTK